VLLRPTRPPRWPTPPIRLAPLPPSWPSRPRPSPRPRPPARKAPATKPAPAKTPRRSRPRSPRLLRSLSWPPAADAPLTKEQKRVLATATVAAATKVLGTAAVKGLPADTTRAQIAQWMAYLPHGGQWPAALPRPPPAS